MNKILFIWVLITSFLLGSCSVDWKDEKEKRITELEKQVQDLKKWKENDLFNKKKECLKFKSEIITSLKETENLDELFYSPKKNSCISRITNFWKLEKVILNDVLTGEALEANFNYSCVNLNKENSYYELWDICYKQAEKFELYIKELKWE